MQQLGATRAECSREPPGRRTSAQNAKAQPVSRATPSTGRAVRHFEQRVSTCAANRIANERLTTVHHEASLAGSGAAQRPWLDLPGATRDHTPSPSSCDLNPSVATATCGFDSHPGHGSAPGPADAGWTASVRSTHEASGHHDRSARAAARSRVIGSSPPPCGPWCSRRRRCSRGTPSNRAFMRRAGRAGEGGRLRPLRVARGAAGRGRPRAAPAPGRCSSRWRRRRSTSAIGRRCAARRRTPGSAGCAHRRAPRSGSDIAGWVDAVGEGVTRFRPGDEVYGDNLGAEGRLRRVRGRARVGARPQARRG